MSCNDCNKQFGSTCLDIVLCSFCEKQFHYDCSKIDRAAINSIKKFSNMCYLCNGCKLWINNNDFAKLLQKIDMIADLASEKMDVKKIETEVAENRKLINELANKIENINSIQPSYAKAATDSCSDNLNSQSESQVVIGTGDAVISIKPANLQVKKYLYISRIDPSVLPEAIVNHICGKLEDCSPDEVECRLLLSKDRAIDSSLTFISFKIGLQETHFNMLNNSEMWPPGIIIRPFINHPRNSKNRSGAKFQQPQ